MLNLFVDYTSTVEKENLFVCSGILLKSEREREVCTKIAALKQRYFKTDSVELRSRWLSIPQLKHERYLSPFGLTDEAFDRFGSELFSVIATLPIRCFGAVVSKTGLQDRYNEDVFDPSTVAYELVLQRVANFLTQYSIYQLRIVCGDNSGKEIDCSQRKDLLVRHHHKLKVGKSKLYATWKTRPRMDYSRIPNQLIFADCSRSTPLQIADLCGHCVMQQGGDFHSFDGDEMYPGYKSIAPIMHRDPKTKKVGGFGAVLFP